MHNPTCVLENEIHRLLWCFEINTDHSILARRQVLIKIYQKNRTCKIVAIAAPADHSVELKETEKKDKYLDLATESK